jgi:hypothetical protein
MSIGEFGKRNLGRPEFGAILVAADETIWDKKKRLNSATFECPACGRLELMKVVVRPGSYLEALIDVTAPCGLQEHWRHAQNHVQQQTTEDRDVNAL